jgi:hypothetical protein
LARQTVAGLPAGPEASDREAFLVRSARKSAVPGAVKERVRGGVVQRHGLSLRHRVLGRIAPGGGWRRARRVG